MDKEVNNIEGSDIRQKADKKKILLVTPVMSSFIMSDISFLSGEYQVVINYYTWKKKGLIPLFLLRQLFFILLNINKFEKILIHFGGYWSLIPSWIGRIYRKPVFIVLHGTDCASIPSIDYGNLRKQPMRFFCRYSYSTANLLLPVSSSLVQIKNSYYKEDFSGHQGYNYFFPRIKTKHRVIHNGIDLDFWMPLAEHPKESSTFISVISENQYILKGGDLVLSLAQSYPSCKFYIVGLNSSGDPEPAPANVTFLGRLEKEDLRKYYSLSQFHLQLSIFEGFGLALCEAMACECIPIGSSVNMIPEIIGDTGFVLKERNLDELKGILVKALSLSEKESFGRAARARIARQFPIQLREKQMLTTLGELD